MGCCGESRQAPNPENRPPQFIQNGPITQQPGPKAPPGTYTIQPFQPDTVGISQPPPSHQNNPNSYQPGSPPFLNPNGYQPGSPPFPSPNGYQPGSPPFPAALGPSADRATQGNGMWGQAQNNQYYTPGNPNGSGMIQWVQPVTPGQNPAIDANNRASTYAPYDASILTQTQLPPSPPASTYHASHPSQGFVPSPTPLLDASIPRPTPVYPSPRPMSEATFSSRGMSDSPGYTSPAQAITISKSTSQPQQISYGPNAGDGRLSVSVDFGTTFSGVAYGSSRIAGGQVQQILSWPGSFEHFRKIPTCLVYDERGNVLSWGLEAKNAPTVEGTIRCEWFKLFLDPKALRDEANVDPRLPRLPPGKKAIDLIIDFLSCIWQYVQEQIQREIGAIADLDSADVWLTVPAAWDGAGCAHMREAAIRAGLVHASKADDSTWRERLHIITEPEAAAVHCVALTDLHHLKPSQNFMICDAGGGTVDLAIYKLIGVLANLEIAEMCARSGANCGSIFLDLRFRELVRTLLVGHPVHLDQASLAYFMHHFSETEKLAYRGEQDDSKMFAFTCFNVEDPDDAPVGLVNGELTVPGYLLRREVFDPIIDQVLNLIEEQAKKVNQRIDALLMVGGFSASEYLFRRVEAQFGSRMRVVRPADADTATCRGAAKYGLARRPLVQSVIAPKAYLMKVKLPAEPEDYMKRLAYVRKNDVGVDICENRLQYLVYKGAILRKGQRIRTKFCKFSQTPQDRHFTAVLYTSDSDRVMRYTDEGETDELCRWTVDLGTLPIFQQAAAAQRDGNGFYTEFELGLELDSAEVRGVLLYNGQDWCSTVFDFLN